MCFYLFPFRYLKKRTLQFADVTDNSDITIELMANTQPIMDPEDEKVKKQNKCIAKRKMQLNNFHAPVQVSAASSAAFLLSCFALVFCLRSSIALLSCP